MLRAARVIHAAIGVGTGGMSRAQRQRRNLWRELIPEQERSGLSVREFCRQRHASEPGWPGRLCSARLIRLAVPYLIASEEWSLTTGAIIVIGLPLTLVNPGEAS